MVLLDEVDRLLGDHEGGGVGVAGGDLGHDGGVHDAQFLYSVHLGP